MALSLGSTNATLGVRFTAPILGAGADTPYAATPNATVSVVRETSASGATTIYTVSCQFNVAGSQNITLRDSTGTYTIAVTVAAGTAPSLSGTPTAATVGVDYNWAPTFTGGIGAGMFRLSGNPLPAGLGLNPSTGAITGRPIVGASSTSGSVITYTDASGVTSVSVAVVVAGATGAIVLPAALSARWTPTFSVYLDASGNYSTNANLGALLPAITKTYYVDPINGVDAAAGTQAAPLKSISVALAKSDVDAIQLVLTANTIFWGSVGINGTIPSRSIALINPTPQYRPLLVPSGSVVSPVWVQNTTFANVYQTPAVATQSAQVVDLKNLQQPNTPPVGINFAGVTSFTAKHRSVVDNAPNPGKVLTKVASIAAVSATTGSWFNDGTNTYVNTPDGRSLINDQWMAMCSNQSTNLRTSASVTGLTYYVQDVDFIGGGSPVFCQLNTTITNTLVLNHCLMQGSSTLNGMNIQGLSAAYLYRCTTAQNWQDGFNYHSVNSDGTTPGTSPSFLEFECLAIGNGTTGSGGSSDNASTAHDFTNGIRLNCVYLDSDDRVVADINSAITLSLGVYVGQAFKVGTDLTASVYSDNSAQVYLDGSSVPVPTNGNVQYWPNSTGAIYYRNPLQPAVNGRGAGTFAPF